MNLSSAEELKGLLIEGFASGRNVHLDLERAEAIDITVLQLLWAAGREAERSGSNISCRFSEASTAIAQDAGFGRFPGMVVQV